MINSISLIKKIILWVTRDNQCRVNCYAAHARVASTYVANHIIGSIVESLDSNLASFKLTNDFNVMRKVTRTWLWRIITPAQNKNSCHKQPGNLFHFSSYSNLYKLYLFLYSTTGSELYIGS
jgi:hypothetical protein